MRHVSLKQIIQGCRQEATQVYQQEAGYCFELFRRAVEQQDTAAWEALQQQYHKLILNWVHTTSQSVLALEAVEDLTQDTWFRFWRTLSHYTEPFSQCFPHVGAVLNYLNQCTISAFLDFERQRRRQPQVQALTVALNITSTWNEVTYWEKREQVERLQLIRDWVVSTVHDPQERLLLTLSYEQNLSPAAIAQHFPTQFGSAADVYRIKERVLKRAKRALAAKMADQTRRK